MNLYLANGRYVGTQAEARKLDRNFSEEGVPTDKPSLIAYLNELTALARTRAPSSAALPPPEAAEHLPEQAYYDGVRAGCEALQTKQALRPYAESRDMSASAIIARSDNPGLDVDGIVTTILESKGHALRRFAGAVALAFTKLGGQ